MNDVNNQKSNNIIIAIIGSLLVLLIGIICFTQFALKNDDKSTTKSETSNNDVNTNNSSKSSDDNSSSNVVDSGSNKKSEVVQKLDLSKSLNTKGITYSNPSDKNGNYGLTMNVNSDKKSATLVIDGKGTICSINYLNVCNGTEKYQITGFKKSIKSTFFGSLGQDITGLVMFFLMDDGTVEYIPLFKQNKDKAGNINYVINVTYEFSDKGIITGEKFVTSGAVKGVEGVVKLYGVSASNGTGWSTTIGAKADGSFYDIGKALGK